MYFDVKEGVKNVKDRAIVFKVFGVLTIILLIPFVLCAGIAKIIFGVFLAVEILFILLILFACFTSRWSDSAGINFHGKYNEDLKTFLNINQEFVREFCTWYTGWQNDIYGKQSGNSDEVMRLGLSLHITKLPDMSVFEKCEKLYFSGKKLQKQISTGYLN